MGISKKPVSTFVIVLFATILINEFIIPSNTFIPKLGLLYTSLKVLFYEHSLVLSFLETLSVIYLELFLLFFIFYILVQTERYVRWIKKIYSCFSNLYFIFSAFLWLLLLMWIPNAFIVNILFLLFLIIADTFGEISLNWERFHLQKITPYLHLVSTSKNEVDLNKSEKYIVSQYVKKSFLRSISVNHKKYFLILILIELLSHNYESIGNLYFIAIEYWNVSFSIILMTFSAIVFYLFDKVLKFIVKKQVGSEAVGR